MFIKINSFNTDLNLIRLKTIFSNAFCIDIFFKLIQHPITIYLNVFCHVFSLNAAQSGRQLWRRGFGGVCWREVQWLV